MPFHFDDPSNIAENDLIKDLANIPAFFAGVRGPFASRPLLHATDSLNYHFGGLDPRGYHFVNLGIHLINGVLLYLLVSMTAKHTGITERNWLPAAALSSLVFVVHPVQTEAVTYIVSRSMLLATTFYLLGFMLFLRATTAQRRRVFYMAGLFAASLLGMTARENFATFPLMLIIYDMFFVSRFDIKKVFGHYKVHVPVVLTLGYLAFIVINNTYDRSVEHPGAGIVPLDYAITQFNVHWTYLRLLILPVAQNADYSYPTARSLFEFPTLVSFIGYIGLWSLGIMYAKKRPMASFGVLWFLITLVPISFAVVLLGLRLGNVIFEHRAYLPSAGAITAAVWAMIFLTEKRASLRAGAVGVLIVMAIVFSNAAYVRNRVWQSDVSLWEDVVKKSPDKDRGYINLGMAYRDEGQVDEAIESFLNALKLDPTSADAHFNLGSAYGSLGLFDRAIEHFEAGLALKPYDARAHYALGMALENRAMVDDAIKHYRESIRIAPQMEQPHFRLGVLYYKRGAFDESRKEFEAALRLNPDNYEAMRFLDDIRNLNTSGMPH